MQRDPTVFRDFANLSGIGQLVSDPAGSWRGSIRFARVLGQNGSGGVPLKLAKSENSLPVLRSETLGCQHIEAGSGDNKGGLALRATRRQARTPGFGWARTNPLNPAGDNPCVRRHIQIRRHPHRYDVALGGVDEHHLAPDEGPFLRPRVSEFKEGIPKGVFIAGKDRHLDRFSVENRPSTHRSCNSWVAARRDRSSLALEQVDSHDRRWCNLVTRTEGPQLVVDDPQNNVWSSGVFV